MKIFTQGGNARYRIRAIYKSEEGCPPTVYKCTKPRTGRNLVWTKQESDTFKGEEGFYKVFFYELICKDVQCTAAAAT